VSLQRSRVFGLSMRRVRGLSFLLRGTMGAVLVVMGARADALTNPNAMSQADYSHGSCTTAERTKINEALAVVRTQLVTNPQPMLGCLKEALFQGAFYGQDPDAAHGEAIIDQMTRTAPAIPIKCETPSGASFGVGFWTGTHIQLVPSVLAREPVASVAATLAHELGHMFSLSHSMDFPIERNFGIPYQVGNCSQQISEGRVPPKPLQWTYGLLSEFKDEVALQPVGFRGGVSSFNLTSKDRDFNTVCPNNLFAQGINGHVSDRVQRIGLYCKNAAGTTTDSSPFVGDWENGQYYTQACYSGEVMVGLWGQAGLEVNSIGPVCAPVSQVQSGTQSSLYYDSKRGTENGSDPEWKRVCPAGMAVRAVKGHFGVASSGTVRDINTIQVVCQKLASPRPLDMMVTGGLNSPQAKGYTTEDCAGRGGMTGFFSITDANGVSRIAGVCSNFSGNGSGIQVTSPGAAYLLPGIGGGGLGKPPGNQEAEDWCSSPSVLVGVDVNIKFGSTNHVRGVRGVCANGPDQAALVPSDTPVTLLPARGPSDGFWVQLRCGNTGLLSGFRAKADWYLHDLYVRCRSFM